jgi:hypothetical protein
MDWGIELANPVKNESDAQAQPVAHPALKKT